MSQVRPVASRTAFVVGTRLESKRRRWLRARRGPVAGATIGWQAIWVGEVDMGEHRVSMLSASLRRYADPEHLRRPADPRSSRQLRTLEPRRAPRAHFRAELRAQLVAVAPRLVAEGAAVETPAHRRARRRGTTPRGSRRRPAPAVRWLFGRRPVSLARPLAVVTAVIALFAVVLGGAVWSARRRCRATRSTPSSAPTRTSSCRSRRRHRKGQGVPQLRRRPAPTRSRRCSSARPRRPTAPAPSAAAASARTPRASSPARSTLPTGNCAAARSCSAARRCAVGSAHPLTS